MADKKIKMLVLCDSPTVATGFAQVSRNVLNGLAATGKFQIDVLGINYHGDYYDREKFPYAIYPAMAQGWADMYGRDRLMAALSGTQDKVGLNLPWDIIFTIQDPFILEGLGLQYKFAQQLIVTAEMWKRVLPPEAWFKWVGYWPVDADVKKNWVTQSIGLSHYPIAYCNWGKSQILKWDKEDLSVNFNIKKSENDQKISSKIPLTKVADRIQVIHHGVDTKIFKPLPTEEIKKFRQEFFKGQVKDDAYLVVNISRNQPRKDIQRTIAAFAQFKKTVKKAHLYLHMKVNDAGGSVDEMARNFDLIPGEDYSTPEDFHPGVGFPVEMINQIYNAADLCITTTLGEGWGFITSEAMATKTPIVAPNITSILDIFNSYNFKGTLTELEDENSQLRGIPAKAGSTSSEWVCLGVEDNERIRPLTNIDDMVEKMIWAYKNPEAVKRITDRAYKWAKDCDWKIIVAQWVELFEGVYENLEKERSLGRAIDKASRNDPCPCGSSKKFKHCHGSQKETDVLAAAIQGVDNVSVQMKSVEATPNLPIEQLKG